MATVANDINDAIVWWWQLGHDILGEPFNDDVDRPIAGFEQVSQAPFDNSLGAPASQLLQHFTSGVDGLHHDQPAQQKSVLAFPHPGHASKDDGDERWQVGQLKHEMSPRIDTTR